MEPKDRIIVAIDTQDIHRAQEIVNALNGKVGGFKLGFEFITSMFAQLMTMSKARTFDLLVELREFFSVTGRDMFWDGKFSDIPNTVAGAVAGLAPISPRFINVHASAGQEAISAAKAKKGESKLLAVTLLTSFDEVMCQKYFDTEPDKLVPRWAKLAVEAGVDGLICSPADLEHLNLDEKLAEVPKMTPGIRPLWSVKGDQSRIMTPKKALEAGATWMVIGRPITECADGPEKAVERIIEELASIA